MQFCLAVEFLVCNCIFKKFTDVLTESTDMMYIYLQANLYECGIAILTVRCKTNVWGWLKTECQVDFLDPRGRQQHLTCENCILGTFRMCAFYETRW